MSDGLAYLLSFLQEGDAEMSCKIIFSDVDGTLLNSEHQLLPETLYSIQLLQQQEIPFVIVSARSPSGIYPIQEKYGFKSPIISYSGSLILDENKTVLWSRGLSKQITGEIIGFIEQKQFNCSWNIYSEDIWIVKDKKDPRIIREENIVQASAIEGNIDLLHDDADIGKVLCMCDPDDILDIEQELKTAFPQLSIVKSSDILLEIMPNGITKRTAVKYLCDLWGIPVEAAAAFGDNYNDVEMLETVGKPFLMGNAPEKLKKQFENITDTNDENGIYHGLIKLGLISERYVGKFATRKFITSSLQG